MSEAVLSPAVPPATADPDDRVWRWLAVGFGITALFAYFFSSVFHVLPWSVGRLLFYAFGPTMAIATVAVGNLLRRQVGARPFFQLGVLCTVIAGIAVNMMAVIQDSNGTVMRQRIAGAEAEVAKDTLRRIFWGINNVQLSLDIVFDIWIAAGCAFFAAGALSYLRQRWFGALGIAVGALALGVNFATLPTPPADAGLFDPGPFVATWFGCFLAVVIARHARRGPGHPSVAGGARV